MRSIDLVNVAVKCRNSASKSGSQSGTIWPSAKISVITTHSDVSASISSHELAFHTKEIGKSIMKLPIDILELCKSSFSQ